MFRPSAPHGSGNAIRALSILGVALGLAVMNKAGWLDLWHLAVTIVARQPPFVQILIAIGIVYVLVMALEGTRTSLLAIWHAHRTPVVLPPPAAQARPITLAAPAPVAAPSSRSFSAKSAARPAAGPARRPKSLAFAPRQFRAPRPKIRRQSLGDVASASEPPELAASAQLTEAV